MDVQALQDGDTNATPVRITRTQRLVHIPELDGLRGLAALMVLFHHVCFTSYTQTSNTPLVNFCARLFEQARTGVDLFFVLSGFLITSLLIKARHSPHYYHDFYWKRALRVLPLYFVCLLCVALFQRSAMGYVVLAAVFLANFASVLHVASTGPFWTLAIEEQFYIAWPTVLRKRSINELQHWALVIGLLCVGLRLVAAWFGHYNYFLTFLHCDGLAFGALLGCWFMQGGERLGGALRERVALRGGFVLGQACVLLAYHLTAGSLREEAYQAACFQTGVTLLAGSIVGCLIHYTNAPFLAVFRGRVLTFFGLISYSMYMVHLYVLDVWNHVLGAPDGANNVQFVVRTLGILAISIALALVTRYLIEVPSMSLRRYVLPPKA